jgi:hypothetical protein
MPPFMPMEGISDVARKTTDIGLVSHPDAE